LKVYDHTLYLLDSRVRPYYSEITVMTSAAIKLQHIYHVLAGLHKRERRKRLVALVGGQARIAEAASVDPATVCRVVAGWSGGASAERVETMIRDKLREMASELEDLWVSDGDDWDVSSLSLRQKTRRRVLDQGASEQQ
jgi:hypothetical protein